ncbi:unnamed protein product [Eruca vesicaria subsp. sativa]|uniref:Uncharacterized protein n=1 Tax=Eruca vesicaria subsp. sativa TaxID=29727 RepID=A0ABC8LZW9_ERUVS|nr:unnamed protein product [Eruca vesicaria subsp. sativa]
MTNTNRDEFKSTNDSELPWMAKGSKGSTRRDEKAIVRVAGSGVENEDKSSSGTVAKESEPGKIQGQHVAERVGRVPKKKRRNMVASPSRRMSSGRRGSSEHRPKINRVSKLNPNLTDGGSSDGSDAKNNSSVHDFSGIILLADAACNLSNDLAPAVDRLSAEEPVVQQQDASTILALGGMIAANKGESESENLAPDSGAVTMSGEPTEKKKSLKEERLHWNLNVSMDAWGPPYDAGDDVSGKDVEGEITESMSPKETKPIDASKNHLDGLVASDGQEKFSSPSGPKANAAVRNGNEFQSDYDSQPEDGELKEQYSWGEKEIEDGEIEPKDYGLEAEDEGFYSISESDDNKMEDSGKRIMAETKSGSDIEKNVLVCMKDSHLKKGSSSSRRFASDDYKELSMGPYRLSGRDERSSGRGYFRGRGSRPRNVLESPHPKCMMGEFDQSRSGSGQGSQPDGYARNRFSNRGYSGRLRIFPNGGDRVFRGRHGYNNQFPGRMHNWMSGNRRERGNSPVFRRSRSRSPVPWNVRDGLSPPDDEYRGDEGSMESVRLPSQKRFYENQEKGFMSPPRNEMSLPRLFERRSYDSGENHNSFRERKFGLGQRHDAGSSSRRLNSENRNNFIPFRRQGRFDGGEDSTGGNKFEMGQQQTRRDEVTEDGGDDVPPGFTKKSRRV